MARAPILAAGGIVVRGGARPLIAVVQRRKDNGWVLPKGKLKRKERSIAAARREVREETGQKVLVHEFLGIISYDDERATYQMRAFNDGRFLQTDVKLLAEAKGMTWGLSLGEIKTSSILRMNEQGEWTEFHEITIGSQPSKKLMEVRVRRQK